MTIITALPPFHFAFPVNDLEKTREFYGKILGCSEGRSSDLWVDFNLYGHQVVAHLKYEKANEVHYNSVDGHDVPVPHFGVVLSIEEFERLATRLREANIKFEIEPYTRFAGLAGEQATMFLHDPAGNALEFKAFRNADQLFSKSPLEPSL